MEAIPGKDLVTLRRLHAVAGVVYLLWWFAVELLLPNYYNPLSSRLSVVGFFALALGLSYFSQRVKNHLGPLLYVGVWLLTAHFFYLLYRNGGDSNWIIGAFITVMAINYCFLSEPALLLYSGFVLALSVAATLLLPSLSHSIFLPGLLTIVLQANIGMHTRLKALRALAESNEQFQLLFNATFEGVLVHENRRIVNANESLAKMVGISRQDLVGKDILDIVYPADRASAAEKIGLADQTPYETRGLGANGRSIDIEVRAKNFTDGNKQVRLVTVQPIGDRKKMEQERISSRSLAENIRVRDEFISIASHELKTPLTSLKLRNQILERDLKKITGENYPAAKMREFVTITSRQIDRLSQLVESMLDVSKIALGKLQFALAPVDLVAVVTETLSMLRTQAEERGSPVSLQAPPSLLVRGDTSRLSQVMENLLTNALKYGDGKPIQVIISTEGPAALLQVIDHGIGISPEYLDKIFERFERAISSKNISGLGLGLYITRQIVAAHGGTISVASELGSGSTFSVTIPLDSASRANS